ncbi:hypothetical protein PV327_005782 [Microctonus hyperodae]|uniref:Uncharacterized protein n=1 Tax=Microctonus hyperodae TaxID=165561 RepID=A0AA39G232_MICHY|nr:hypothetical protein PV327_005782 [Microctonus hyperodae]
MNEVGDFITYHDVEKSSAVVYFKKGNFFNGLVDTRFIISQLPLNNIGRVAYFEVGGPYINAREGFESEQYFHNDQDTLSFKPLTDQEINYVNTLIDSIINPTLSSMPSASQTHDYQPANNEMISTSDDINYNKPSTPNQIEYIPQPNAHKKSYHSPSTVLHPEILVFISFEVIRNFV